VTLARARVVNGALVALAVALTSAVILTEGSVTTSERLAREGNVLAVYRPDEVESLRITRFDSKASTKAPEELLLLRDQKSQDPHAFFLGARGGRKADPAAVAELLTALEYAVWLRTIDPADVDRKAFGLDQPRLELRLGMGGTSHRLVVGAAAPTPRGAHYAELSGTGVTSPGVGLISGDFVEKLDRDSHAFLGKLLLPYAKSDLAGLRLSGDGGERHLIRDAAGFRLGAGKGPRVDGEALDRLLFQMARVSAEEYLEPEAARKALGSGARVRIDQKPKEGAVVTVEIGGQCPSEGDPTKGGEPSLVALRTTEPLLAGCVPATVMPSLTAGEEELVQLTPFSLHADEVDHVTIIEVTATGPRQLEALRSGSAFELIEPRKQNVELDAGNDFIKALVSPNGELWTKARLPDAGAGTSPVQRPDLAALGLLPARGTVRLIGVTEGNPEPVEQLVSFSAPDTSGRVWLRREDDGAVLALGRGAAWPFSTDDTWTRSRALIDVDKDAIRRIVVDPGATRQVLEQNTNGEVQLVEPKGFEVDAPLASDWLTAVAHLRAARWLRRDDVESQSASSPTSADERGYRVEVTYATAAGERSAKFFVSRRTVGGFFARWEGDAPGWFVLPTEIGRALQTAPISRFAVSVDIANVSRLALRGQGISHTLERRAGELMSVEGSLTRDAVVELEQALSALRPVAALHIGPALPNEGFEAPELVLEGVTHTPGREDEPFTLRFGRIGSHLGQTVQYARADGVNATFIIDRSDVQHVLDLL
jgi:hypothetical protein